MERYLDPTPQSGAALIARKLEGEVLMLSLLRFREVADYTDDPYLAPAAPISGWEAYQIYIDHTMPFLERSGGDLVLMAQGGTLLIGPPDERWDVAVLVRQRSLADFMVFASNQEYMAGIGHRTAALEDCRMLPLVELPGSRAVELLRRAT